MSIDMAFNDYSNHSLYTALQQFLEFNQAILKYAYKKLLEIEHINDMSHPVFLTSSHLNHMPVGSQNQWANFFKTASFELEANAFIPILWLMLFKQDNIYGQNTQMI